MDSNRKIGSVIMFTVLCSYLLMPIFYMFVINQHKYNVLTSINRQDSKSFVFSFTAEQLQNMNFQKNDDEIVIHEKHFEVIHVIQSKSGFQISVIPDEFEDNFVCSNKLTQENWQENTCCWPFFEQILSLRLNFIFQCEIDYSKEIAVKIYSPSLDCIVPPPELFS